METLVASNVQRENYARSRAEHLGPAVAWDAILEIVAVGQEISEEDILKEMDLRGFDSQLSQQTLEGMKFHDLYMSMEGMFSVYNPYQPKY